MSEKGGPTKASDVVGEGGRESGPAYFPRLPSFPMLPVAVAISLPPFIASDHLPILIPPSPSFLPVWGLDLPVGLWQGGVGPWWDEEVPFEPKRAKRGQGA